MTWLGVEVGLAVCDMVEVVVCVEVLLCDGEYVCDCERHCGTGSAFVQGVMTAVPGETNRFTVLEP